MSRIVHADPAPHATIQVVSFHVEGMTCASCVNRITRTLRKVGGVRAAKVSLATESATVRFDPTLTDVASLGRAVELAGYVARVDQIDAGGTDADASTSFARWLSGIRQRIAVARSRHPR